MSAANDIKTYRFPTAEELGEVRSLASSEARGWEVEDGPDAMPDLPAGVAADSTHAYIWEHAQEAAAVVRTVLSQGENGVGPLTGLSAEQIVAAFFVALGQEVGVRVMRQLEQSEAAKVGKAIARLEAVAHNVGMHALETVRQRLEEGDYLDLGGEKYARSLMTETVASWWADGVIEDAKSSDASPWELLGQMRPGQIAPYLSHEHPQTIALLLSQINPTLAAGILSQLPERLQADVAYRISTMEEISGESMQRLESALKRLVNEMGGNTFRAGGPKVMADMLNMTGSSVERNVLKQMDEQDEEAAEAVRSLMFVFDDIKKLADREIQKWLKEVDQKDLVVALRAAGDEMKEKIFKNCSEKVRTFLQEEMEFLGPMRLSEVEEVQLRLVKIVRQLEEKGEITIVRGDTNEEWV